jgi:glutaredoxin-related protein
LKRKHSVEIIDVSDNQSLREAHSLKNNRWPTVPMISVCNDEKNTEEFIGGYTDLMNYFDGKKYQHTAD